MVNTCLNELFLDFLAARTKDLLRNGISVILTNKADINGTHSGSFCPARRELRVAMNNGKESMHAFLHEYSHYLQWKHDYDFWFANYTLGYVPFMRWLSGSNIFLRKNALDTFFERAVTLERDAESKALRILKTYGGLGITASDYRLNANINLLLYPYSRIHRDNNRGALPGDPDEIRKILPDRLLTLKQLTDKEKMSELLKKITSF